MILFQVYICTDIKIIIILSLLVRIVSHYPQEVKRTHIPTNPNADANAAKSNIYTTATATSKKTHLALVLRQSHQLRFPSSST
jgi:hypothetical protein